MGDEEETLQTKPLAGQITPLVQRQEAEGEEEEEEEELIQAKPLAAQITPLVQRQEAEGEDEEEEEEPIQAKPARGSTPHVGPGLATQIRSLRGGGRPLSQVERWFFEPRFGYDFSQVRVHTGDRAAQAARALNARAFTFDKDIAFNSGQYEPAGSPGRRLMAHELAHITQRLPRVARQVPGARRGRRPRSPSRSTLIPRIRRYVAGMRGLHARKSRLFNLLRRHHRILKSDQEVVSILKRGLVGGDQWYSLALLHYGPERNWPLPNRYRFPDSAPDPKGEFCQMIRTWRDGVRTEALTRGRAYLRSPDWTRAKGQWRRLEVFIRAVFLQRGDRDYTLRLVRHGSEKYWDERVVREFASRRDVQPVVTKPGIGYKYFELKPAWRRGRWIHLSYKDIEQGQLGDCWFLAALAAIAKLSPRFLDRMIKFWLNGTVTVYFRDVPKGTVKAQINLQPGFPVRRGKLVYARKRERSKGHWVAILEKAYAIWKGSGGGYRLIGQGGYIHEALSDLLGGATHHTIGSFRWCANPVTRTQRMNRNRIGTLITNALRDRRPVVTSDHCRPTRGRCGTPAQSRRAQQYYDSVYMRRIKRHKLQGCHAYAVLEITGHRVKLYDPHGWEFNITTQVLEQNCEDLAIGSKIR